MKVAEYGGYLLELGQCDRQGHFHAWLSHPNRCVIGYGKATTEEEAIRLAMYSAFTEEPADYFPVIERCALNYLKVRPFCGGTG